MNKNLLRKTVLIVAVLIFFLFGIFGIPSSFTRRGPAGLGAAAHPPGARPEGRHPPDSAGAGERRRQCRHRPCGRAAEGSSQERNITFAEISKPDPQHNPEVIAIKGVPPESSADLRRIVSERAAGIRPDLGRRELPGPWP